MFIDAELPLQLEHWAGQVSALSAWLDTQGVKVVLQVRSVPMQQPPPPSGVLEALAPFLHQLDYYTVSPSFTAPNMEDLYRSVRYFTAEQATALQAASALQTLCISGEDAVPPIAGFIPPIAALHSLTKLHLTLPDFQPDFQPLLQLSSIEHLALQCLGESSSCHDLLTSSSASLRHVTLASYSWDHDTYSALQGASALTTVSIKVHSLHIDAARILGNLPVPE